MIIVLTFLCVNDNSVSKHGIHRRKEKKKSKTALYWWM